MEQNTGKKVSASKPLPGTPVSYRMKSETKRRIQNELAKLNKKDFGKKIRGDELLNLSLSLIQDDHRRSLQEASLTNADRVEILYREHVKKHGPMSKDEFFGQLLSGNVAKGPST